MEKTFDAVIIANGAFPTHAVPLDILHHAAHLIACDGAIAPLLLEGLGEAVIIGDGDSVPAEFRDRLIQITEQDDNDQTKATRYCVEHGWKRIAYLGSTGKREDHTLGPKVSVGMPTISQSGGKAPSTKPSVTPSPSMLMATISFTRPTRRNNTTFLGRFFIAEANSSLFTFHFSLFFVPLQPDY